MLRRTVERDREKGGAETGQPVQDGVSFHRCFASRSQNRVGSPKKAADSNYAGEEPHHEGRAFDEAAVQ